MKYKNNFRIMFVRLGADFPTGSGSESEVTHISGEWADGRFPKPELLTRERAIELIKHGMLKPFMAEPNGTEHRVQIVKTPNGKEVLRTGGSFAERNMLLDLPKIVFPEDVTRH